jgi:hypothetical protein
MRARINVIRGIRDAPHSEDYPSDEVQEMAQQIASEHARSICSVQAKTLADIRSEPTHEIARLRPVLLAGIPQRIASVVAATLRLIQNLEGELIPRLGRFEVRSLPIIVPHCNVFALSSPPDD